jgi:uncharacterized protein YbjT (DUF2867 family)
MTKLITVFGSTGNQGGSVVRAILNHPELSKQWKIRGITRNANKPDAQALVKKGVEMVSVSHHVISRPRKRALQSIAPQSLKIHN